MTKRFVIARAVVSMALALLVGLGSAVALGPEVALAKKKNKNKNVATVEVTDVVVCHVLKIKKRSGPSLGVTETLKSDDRDLKNTDRFRPGTCEDLGIPTG